MSRTFWFVMAVLSAYFIGIGYAKNTLGLSNVLDGVVIAFAFTRIVTDD